MDTHLLVRTVVNLKRQGTSTVMDKVLRWMSQRLAQIMDLYEKKRQKKHGNCKA